MPRVLGIVSFRILPAAMGGQRGVALFYKHLSRQLQVVLAASNDNEKSRQLTMHNFLYPNKKTYLNGLRMRKLLELAASANADLCIAEHSYTGWMAWWVKRKTSIPFIIHSHNIESLRFKKMDRWWWKLYHRYESWIHNKADHSFFISEEDRHYAEKNFNLQPGKTSVVTYGIEDKRIHPDRRQLKTELGFNSNTSVILFNGTLDYEPNLEAVETLIRIIEPGLRTRLDNFLIVITGNRASPELLSKMQQASNIHFAGYVDDVDLYYQAADVFINPVANNTGVKTKLIEAIANGCVSISTAAGANGLNKSLCGNKLIEIEDDNWKGFINAIVANLALPYSPPPQAFVEYYSWTAIATKAALEINRVIKTSRHD